MGWLRKRFGESSTYTGVGVAASMLTIMAGNEGMAAASPIVALLIGFYDIARAEKK